MKRILLAVALIAACGQCQTVLGQAAVAAEPQPYRGWKLVSVDVTTPAQLMALEQFATPMACVPHPGASQQYAISGDDVGVLDGMGVAYRVIDNDLQGTLNLQAQQVIAAHQDRNAAFFTTYRTITEINAEMDALVAAYPTLATKVQMPVPSGFTANTIEGRTIYGLKITGTSTTPGNPANPVFFINACQHAREWISPMTCMWAVEQLLGNYSTDTSIKQLVDNVTWYFVPVVNVDGYIYTFPVAQGGQNQRLWRKNRRNNGNGTFGVDTNRNWAVGYGLNSGSSGSGSSDTYRGTAAFSEPETRSLRDFMLSLSGVKAAMDLHSYSELVLAPWSYTTASISAADLAVWNPLTTSVTNAIANTYGSPYIGGPTGQILYLASGVAGDWAYAPAGVTNSPGIHALGFGIELRDQGTYGFTLPADQIVPTGTEAFNGLKVIANYIQKRLQVDVSSPPSSLSENTAAPFGVTISTFNNYTIQSGSTKLWYRTTPSGAFTGVAMTGGPTSYTATVPAEPCGTTVQYYVEALASDGAIVRNPADAPVTLFSASTPACPPPPCVGDVNGDHSVNSIDLGIVLSNFGSSVPVGTLGDLNSDGVVNTVDLGSMLAAFGSTCP